MLWRPGSLLAVGPLVAEHRLQVHGLQQLQHGVQWLHIAGHGVGAP